MRVEELLTEIEPLDHRDRCRRLAGLRDVAALLEELGGRGHYERSVALFIASAVRDERSLEHIARTTRDADSGLTVQAIGLAARLGLGAEAFDLDDAPAAVRSATYLAIRRWGRTDLAERFIGPVAERWGETEAAALLPACGDAVVRERLDGLAHAVVNWRSLGRAHPFAVLDFAERRLAELPEGVLTSWWYTHAPALAAAVPHAPDRVVSLLERYWLNGPMPQALLPRAGMLLDAERDRMLRVLLAKEHRSVLRDLLGRRAIRDRVAQLDDGDLAAVARAMRDDGIGRNRLMLAFAPSRRARVFDTAMAGVDRDTAETSDALLEILPHAVRAREARRMLGLRRVTDDPARRWAVTAFLPYDEAEPVLRELTRRPDADERATGYRLLFRCAGRSRDPEVLTRLLESAGRLRNEQDPVRQVALGALADVPPGILQVEHGAAFAQFAEDALAARDCSYQSRHALVRLASQLCRQGAIRSDEDLVVFGLGMLERVVGNAGSVDFGRLDAVLRRGQEHDLMRIMAPRLTAAARRRDHGLALALARSLRRRAHHLPELQNALEQALDAREDSVITSALALWLAPPGTRGERVGRFVAREPSAIGLPLVFGTIARERTDLLHLALSGTTRSGRFMHGDMLYVPMAQQSWMRRWTARQRSDYLVRLHAAATDADVPDHLRARCVSAVAQVPGTGAAELRRYLDPDARPSYAGEDLLRRVALTAAPWTSAPGEVFALLLAYAGSDDAHVATYAASRAARFVAPSVLADALSGTLTQGKITARKEALRILLRNRVPEAMERLAAAWEAPGQHPDVRSAIVSAARQHLADPAADRILTEAAEGPRDMARYVVGAAPLAVEERFRARYAALVLRVARSDDVETRLIAIPALAAWVPWAPEAPAVLASHLTDLEITDTWRAAMSALVSCAVAGTGAAELTAAARRLAASPAEPDAGDQRDLPALQRLTALAAETRMRFGYDRESAGRAVRALDGVLPEPLASELLAATLRWDAPDAAAAVDALADRPIGGVLAVGDVAQALIEGGFVNDLYGFDGLYEDFADILGAGYPEPDEILPHAARLAARGDLTGGLFACSLAGHHGHGGHGGGWKADWRDLLRRLRAHPDPEVAYAARRIRTAEE